jgi:hypothetical protein
VMAGRIYSNPIDEIIIQRSNDIVNNRTISSETDTISFIFNYKIALSRKSCGKNHFWGWRIPLLASFFEILATFSKILARFRKILADFATILANFTHLLATPAFSVKLAQNVIIPHSSL